MSELAAVHLNQQTDTSLDGHALRVGAAVSNNHFGEYLQAYFHDLPDKGDRAAISTPVVSYEDALKLEKKHYTSSFENKALERFTLAKTGSSAKFMASTDTSEVKLKVQGYEKSKNAAHLTLAYIGKSNCGGLLDVWHDLPKGYGLGTSTSDVLSTISAVADSFGVQLTSSEIAQIALEAEGACDAIMYDRAGLFITTKCQFLEYYDVPFPKVMILGLDLGREGQSVNTLELPVKEYTRLELNQYSLLRKAARNAFYNSDVKVIGQIATQSALLNQRFLPKPHLDEVIKIARLYNADGVICGHSGSVLGIMYDFQYGFSDKSVQNLSKDLQSIGVESVNRFYSA